MATPPQTPGQLNKVVVACLDGRRLKGYVYNFSPMRDWFHLLPQENPSQAKGEKVLLKDLKAVFFVRDFAGDPTAKAPPTPESSVPGRRIEIQFVDGEIILGTTQGYTSEKPGFFMFPAAPGNDLRIFVVNRNARQVRFV